MLTVASASLPVSWRSTETPSRARAGRPTLHRTAKRYVWKQHVLPVSWVDMFRGLLALLIRKYSSRLRDTSLVRMPYMLFIVSLLMSFQRS